MLFYTYPAELVVLLKSKGADHEIETTPSGNFRLKLRSHFIDAKSLMNQQNWIKSQRQKIWKLIPPAEDTDKYSLRIP